MDFVGRDDIIAQIGAVLNPKASKQSRQSTTALTGLGGMGKTQSALAYVFKSWDLFHAILWIRVDSREKILYTFADFAFELGLVENNFTDQNTALEEVMRWFENTDVPWLVVFDNADAEDDSNMTLVQEFWPRATGGSILITTQDKKLAVTFAQKNIIQLERLETTEAIKLLCRTWDERTLDSEAESNATRLIQSEGLTFNEFLLLYDKTTLIDSSDPNRAPSLRYDHSLQTVWNVAFQMLKKDPLVGRLVNIISFLDTERIPEKLISSGVDVSDDERLSFLKGAKNFIRYRSKLIFSALVYRNEDLRMIWMHGLVQETCHMRMTHVQKQEAFELATEILQNVWPIPEMHNRRQNSLWPKQQDLVSHVVCLGQFYRESHSRSSDAAKPNGLRPDKKFAQLLYNAGWYFVETDLLSSAEALLSLAKEVCETSIKDPELILADIYGAFGGIDSERNELRKTLENFRKQYKYLQRAFDKKLLTRPNVREALALGGLAQGHAGLDELPEAEKYFRQCIAVWEECPGDSTIYQSHLGTCLAFQGKLDDAEKHLVNLIEARAIKFGPRDTTSYRTGLLYYALGNVLRRQERLDEAYEIEKACLMMWLTTCGQTHHYTAEAYYKVAWHLQHRMEYQKAREMYTKALDIYNKDEMLYTNEIARVEYMLGTTYRQCGMTELSKASLRKSEALGKSIKGKSWTPTGEESYDSIVSFWSR
ncbi:P-loop containing nucleoside triphosphate hydrolase protein [Penicillium malachiteum]|uniref:P-loop containing nucleoside triphosphate hydrolase protein n=1 Tax=Penicillium malachiteum TaxID=1324776 RepID=UPI00254926EB|nr:P-loop containing nucleoside triphosphate hydrolase protein [Penicillium malachiteum]KAJ5726207.1 P-loop containing nucleoside triphosphate hydrolase protein [Penicillium malachiteum]